MPSLHASYALPRNPLPRMPDGIRIHPDYMAVEFHNSSPFAHSVFLIRDLYCGYSVINRLITLASFQ